MDPLLAWILCAVITERVVEILGYFLPVLDHPQVKKFSETFVNVKLMLALLIGVVFSFGADISVFAVFNIPFHWPYVGEAIAAVFVMAGSHYIHGLITTIDQARQLPREEDFLKLFKNIIGSSEEKYEETIE